MDAGFSALHIKVDGLKDQFTTHQAGCMQHFYDIEGVVQDNKRRHDERQSEEVARMDWWKWIIRGTTSVIALGAAAFIWKLITGGAQIVIGG